MLNPPLRLSVAQLLYVGLDYVLAHPIHSVEYREFVLKYMLTYGLAPALGFYHSPLWKAYTDRILFAHVLVTMCVTKDADPVYQMREGVVEQFCPEGVAHE